MATAPHASTMGLRLRIFLPSKECIGLLARHQVLLSSLRRSIQLARV